MTDLFRFVFVYNWKTSKPITRPPTPSCLRLFSVCFLVPILKVSLIPVLLLVLSRTDDRFSSFSFNIVLFLKPTTSIHMHTHGNKPPEIFLINDRDWGIEKQVPWMNNLFQINDSWRDKLICKWWGDWIDDDRSILFRVNCNWDRRSPNPSDGMVCPPDSIHTDCT